MTATAQFTPLGYEYHASAAPLTVRAINDLANSVDNYAQFVGAHKTHSYPLTDDDAPYYTALPYFNNQDDEYVLFMFAPRYVPSHFKKWIVSINGALSSGLETSYEIRVYSHGAPYRGPRIVDDQSNPNEFIDFFDGRYDSQLFTLTSSTTSSNIATIDMYRNFWGGGYLTITGRSPNSSDSAHLYTFDAQPAMESF